MSGMVEPCIRHQPTVVRARPSDAVVREALRKGEAPRTAARQRACPSSHAPRSQQEKSSPFALGHPQNFYRVRGIFALIGEDLGTTELRGS